MNFHVRINIFGFKILCKSISGNRLEPDYSQFGINFPAPAPSDYDNEEDTKLDGLIPISANSITSEIAVPTESSSVTLFPIPEEVI